MVELEGNEFSFLSCLQKGMVLKGGAVVECLVEYPTPTTVYPITNFLYVSTTQPYRRPTRPYWVLPVQNKQTARHPTKVFNLILSSDHVLETVDGLHAVTLGHGRTDGSVVSTSKTRHASWIQRLKRLHGYETGRLVLPNGYM
jgi:hypothetical protein